MTEHSSTVLQGSESENTAAVKIVERTSPAGHRFYCRPETEDNGVFEYVVDHNEYKLPSQFNPDDVVIDIGAHIGSFAYTALLRGAGKVYAYEAHPENYQIARMNLANFGDRLSLHNLAVWRSDIPAQVLYNDDIAGYTKTGGISLLWNNDGVPVETRSLDEILSEASNGFNKPIRLLKIDCEGSEYPILFTSKRLDIVEEIRGEYHEMKPEQIPDRARTQKSFERFDRFALKDFFERLGWSIELEPKADTNGLFHAFRRQPEFSDSASLEDQITVEKLMAQIRQAVARREADGKTSFINASSELFKVLSEDRSLWDNLSSGSMVEQTSAGPDGIPQLRLQPEFYVREDDRYHLNDLLQYHDSEFVWNAYRALLKRDPDEEGYQQFLELLRSGRRNKIDILASLQRSAEGKRANVTVEGLAVPATIRRLFHLPIIGYFLELTTALARLPVLVRNQRQLESHLIAQQDRIVGHFTQTHYQLRGMIDLAESRLAETTRANAASFQDALTGLAEQQKRIAELQHQQVTALFREQQKITNNQGPVTAPAPSQAELDRLQASFEDRFRGESEQLKTDLGFYLSLLKESNVTSEILDLGCGRGEWLELLKDEGILATGLESNGTLAIAGRNRGLRIVHEEAIEYLGGLPNNSLQAVTGFHLIEHLEFHQLLQLLTEIRRTLRPGGLVIFETPNPKNLVVGACNFYADPTHCKPVFPETLQFLLESLGFERVRLEYRHPVEGSPFDNAEPGSRELDIWLFGPRDFAAIGWKP